MAYVAPQGIGDPGATRATAVALRRRAATLEDMLYELSAAHDIVELEGPGGDRYRQNLRAAIQALGSQAIRCRDAAARLDGAAIDADRMITRQRREQAAEQAAKRAQGGW